MTKKDFEIIAETIRNLQGITLTDRAHIIRQFADALARTNPAFNSPRFWAACQVKGTI